MTGAVAEALAHSEGWVLEAPEADDGEGGVEFSAEFFKATRTHTDGALSTTWYFEYGCIQGV